jgi:hypothetical protein
MGVGGRRLQAVGKCIFLMCVTENAPSKILDRCQISNKKAFAQWVVM